MENLLLILINRLRSNFSLHLVSIKVRKLFISSRAPLLILLLEFRVQGRKRLSIQWNGILRINPKYGWLLYHIAMDRLVQHRIPLQGLIDSVGNNPAHYPPIKRLKSASYHITGTFKRDPSKWLYFLWRPSHLLSGWEDLLLECLKIILGIQITSYFLYLLLGSVSSFLISVMKTSLERLLLFYQF